VQGVSRISSAKAYCFNFLEPSSHTLLRHLSNVNGTLDVSGAPRHVSKNIVGYVVHMRERNDIGVRRDGETIVSSNATLLGYIDYHVTPAPLHGSYLC
jgi:hypothetical protein